MHILSAINNNIHEWRDLLHFSEVRPRLPLPYALGGAFVFAGHTLSGIDLCSAASKANSTPFQAIYHKREVVAALRAVDVAILWGGFAYRSLLLSLLNARSRRKICCLMYSMPTQRLGLKHYLRDVAVSQLGNLSGGVVVMTSEQECLAKEYFGDALPVIKLRCGIDTAFYRLPSLCTVIPDEYRRAMDDLLKYPYVVMPGDELRCNDDAIKFVERTNLRLIRISQYGDKSDIGLMKRRIHDRGLGNRIFVFEKISYEFLRFILQHAAGYVGLVDSSWQPAGWTVACEALASGLPMVLYEGLVSRELVTLGASSSFVRSVPLGDIDAFAAGFCDLLEHDRGASRLMNRASTFAIDRLDFGVTASAFVTRIEEEFAGA